MEEALSHVSVSENSSCDNKTIVEYITLRFDQAMADDFFTVQNMKRVR